MNNPDTFYRVTDRSGLGTALKPKHVRQFRLDFVEAADFRAGMSVLELGCGTGLFLRFLEHLQVADFVGVDNDGRNLASMGSLASRLAIADIDSYVSNLNRTFDRIVMFDVFEHFTPTDGVKLLRAVSRLLSADGRIVIRVPNMASPFGMAHQFGDLTHKAMYTPDSLGQAARAAGLNLQSVRPQSNNTIIKQARMSAFTVVMKLLCIHAPWSWSPNFIAVIARADA